MECIVVCASRLYRYRRFAVSLGILGIGATLRCRCERWIRAEMLAGIAEGTSQESGIGATYRSFLFFHHDTTKRPSPRVNPITTTAAKYRP
jgi:hypothetical protein